MKSSPTRLTILLAGLWIGAAQAAPECNVATLQKLAPAGVQVTSAQRRQNGQSPYCEVEGTMPMTGNSLRYRMGLPEAWNGKFLFEATGGGAGVLVGMGPGAQRGYAVATTDTGHEGSVGDFSFWLDRSKRAGWIHEGVHTATVGAKAMVVAYYGRTPQQSFLRGCSNGGRAGLMEAQRYPEDYDGILSAAPAADPGAITINWIRDAQILHRTPLDRDDWNLVGRTVRESCDARDGLHDGMIQDSRRCVLPREQLACKAGRTSGCLGDAKLAALDQLWNKPQIAGDVLLFDEGHGYEDQMPAQAFYAGASPWTLLRLLATSGGGSGNEFSMRATEPPPPLRTLLPWLVMGAPSAMDQFVESFGAGVLMPDRRIDVRQFDVAKDGPELARQIRAIISDTDRPDLAAYLKRGSKLLLWQGMDDVTLPPGGTFHYFDLAREHALRDGISVEAFDQSVRLYTAPTIGHCAGGDGPNEGDLFGALDAWVTQAKTPEAFKVVRRDADGKIVRSRPLCPLPQEARYSGRGSIDDAGSFVCAVPPDRVGMTGVQAAAP